MLFKSAGRYGDALNSYDAMKLVALLAMVIDHMGVFFFPHNEWLRAIGRYAFPAFLFLVGYSGSWKIKPDILLFAVVVQVVAALTHHHVLPFNILFSIVVVRLVLRFVVNERNCNAANLAVIFGFCVVLFPASIFFVEYGSIALLYALCGYMQRHYPTQKRTTCLLAGTILFHALMQQVSFHFHAAQMALAAVVLGAQFLQFRRFSLRTVQWPRCMAGLNKTAQWLSHNALLLYPLHVIAFMLLEYHYFPERLAHFKWM